MEESKEEKTDKRNSRGLAEDNKVMNRSGKNGKEMTRRGVEGKKVRQRR
jgi:hypothetical protein